MLKLEVVPFRLKFKRPFGTAHGTRDGTDSVFVRLDRNGLVGFGEATTPPYVKEQQGDVLRTLRAFKAQIDEDRIFGMDPDHSPAARAALTTAYYALTAREKGISASELFEVGHHQLIRQYHLFTLGLMDQAAITSDLRLTPPFNGLKIKLDGMADEKVLEVVLEQDDRPVLLDANQSWTSVDHALRIIDLVGPKRLIGLEQPFAVDREDLQEQLAGHQLVTIYADESVRSITDLQRNAGMFGGVNVKLMKCGGLDKAAEIIRHARAAGLKVMLGSMSESSLGCGAMMQLAPWADVIDLDGPWLIANDPFQGLALKDGRLMIEGTTGLGIEPIDPRLFRPSPSGA